MIQKKLTLLFAAASLVIAGVSFAQDKDQVPVGKDQVNKATKTKKPDPKFKKFEEAMSGVKLIGTFTIDGRGGKLSEEEYIIEKVKKVEGKNLWLFTTRIKYGSLNVAVPLTLPVEWAGDTPMISISNFKIPLVGRGAFGARVIFHDNKYAGTWSHDKVGGHMFGRIEKIKKEKSEPKKD